MSKLKFRLFYLIDGSGYIFRAYYFATSSRKSDGLPTGAVSGFCSMLFKLLEDLIDDSKETNTCSYLWPQENLNEIYKDYKANRSEAPEDLAPQFEYIRKSVKAFNCFNRITNYEADDLIATYANKLLNWEPKLQFSRGIRLMCSFQKILGCTIQWKIRLLEKKR